MRGHDTPLEYHRRLLDDAVRVTAYERAILDRIGPGDVVLDVGCGTGILSMMAARQGARVHAVESMPVARLARRVVEANGLADRITVHEADLRELDPVEPVDWMLGEYMGRFLVGDEMMEAVVAAGRWLKPDGQSIPEEIRLYVAPVGDVALPSVDAFRETLLGFDLSPAVEAALRTCYATTLTPEALIGPPQLYYRWRPPAEPAPFDGEVTLELSRSGTLRGLAGWFEADLAPGVTLSTAPGTHTHWGQYLFPVDPVAMSTGTMPARIWLTGDDWNWTVGDRTRTSATWREPLPAVSVPEGIPSVPENWGRLGVERAGRMADTAAIRALDRADPSDEEAARWRVVVLLRLGRRTEALAALEAYEQGFGAHPWIQKQTLGG